MKQFVTSIFACFLFCAPTFAQTQDSIFSENKVNGVWKKTELDIITRNSSCATVSFLQMQRNENSQLWVNSFLSTYDSSGNVDRVFTQSWDECRAAKDISPFFTKRYLCSKCY